VQRLLGGLVERRTAAPPDQLAERVRSELPADEVIHWALPIVAKLALALNATNR
jgi:hypothetical protein